MAVEPEDALEQGVADAGGAVAQDASRERQLRAAQRNAGNANVQGKAKGVAEVQKEVRDIQTLLKGVKIGSAASVIGLVVTALVMTYEFLLGNWLHMIPNRLSDFEKPALAILWAVILVALLIVFVVFFVIVTVISGLF